ncbi:hypothetical protein [Streptomyces sp. NPDC048248]|uniref:terpene synthase family protein n=1 Tax=Streptomyces sp. NPDC048248 TaxID=3365523 RepID=UPI00371331E6
MTTERWAERHGLLQDARAAKHCAKARFGRLAGRASPRSDPDGLQFLTDWMTWETLLDDFCERAHPGDSTSHVVTTLAQLSAESRKPLRTDPDAEPFAAALRDLLARLRGRANAPTVARVINELSNSFMGTLWELTTRCRDSPPGLREFRNFRWLAAPNGLSCSLTAVADELFVAEEEYYRPDVVAVTNSAITEIGLVNDIYSFASEVGNGEHNLPTALMRECGHPPEAAIAMAVQEHDEEVRFFLTTEAQAAESASPALRAYLTMLRTGMRGHLDWMLETARYGRTAAGPQQGQETDSPHQRDSREEQG